MTAQRTENKRVEKKKIEEEMVHECRLPPEEDMLVRYIDSGLFVNLRRSIRRMMLVSERNPRSKFYLKSSFAIKREKEKHLKEHYYMIHPFSKFRFCWEVFMIFVFMFLLVLIPILLTYSGRNITGVFMRVALDAICIIDIVINFNTGYQHPNTKKIILQRKKVAIRYLSTWFFVDLITVINVDILIFYLDTNEYMFYIRMPTILKVFRIFTLFMYMNRFRDYMQYNLQVFKMINVALIVSFLWLWSTCLLYRAASVNGETWLKDAGDDTMHHLLVCLKRITNLFLLISGTQSDSLAVIRLEMVCLAGGIILQLFVVAQLYQLVSMQMTSRIKYYATVKQFKCFLARKNIPDHMTRRAVQFFHFSYQRCLHKEFEILSTTSAKLNEEIQALKCKKFAEQIRLFQGLPHSVVLRVSSLMKPEVFLPNDVIVRAGLPSSAIYFISSGTVAVYTSSGKEILHLTDGDNFGETSLVMEYQVNLTSVVAADYCDMYILTRRDFVEIVEIYPELYKRIIECATARFALVREVEGGVEAPEFFDFSSAEGQQAFYRRLYEL